MQQLLSRYSLLPGNHGFSKKSASWHRPRSKTMFRSAEQQQVAGAAINATRVSHTQHLRFNLSRKQKAQKHGACEHSYHPANLPFMVLACRRSHRWREALRF